MYDTQVTVQGWVGGPVTVHEFDADSRLAKFRLGATPRVRRDGQWVDGETAWYSVRAWGQLGRNVSQSVQRGEAVIVTGRLRRSSWTGENGVENSDWEIDATAVGHDLSRGNSRFTKPEARTSRQEQDEEQPAEAEAPAGVDPDTGEITEGTEQESWRAPDPALV
ncbi:single-stranded DNA-binding protein [Nocardioidaceae bacterium]|nr:single-stranded DNA-binding protein [Nocardioidaceae bacterium]